MRGILNCCYLFARYHTHILWDHTTFCVTSHALFLDITPSIFDSSSNLSVSSRPVHQLYHTNSLYDITHTLCMTSHSVCVTSHEHIMTSHLYRYDIKFSIFVISYPIYMISPILFHENKTTIPGISPTVFDITATAQCGLTRSINAFTTVMEDFTLGTGMTSYTPYLKTNSDFMTSNVSI